MRRKRERRISRKNESRRDMTTFSRSLVVSFACELLSSLRIFFPVGSLVRLAFIAAPPTGRKRLSLASSSSSQLFHSIWNTPIAKEAGAARTKDLTQFHGDVSFIEDRWKRERETKRRRVYTRLWKRAARNMNSKWYYVTCEIYASCSSMSETCSPAAAAAARKQKQEIVYARVALICRGDSRDYESFLHIRVKTRLVFL